MNLGMPEMIFIFLLALIIFGPKKLPEIGRQIGRALTEFKRASNEFKMQIEDEIRQLEYDEEQKRTMVAQSQPAAVHEITPPTIEAESHSGYGSPAPPEGTVAYSASANGGSHLDYGAAAHPETATPTAPQSNPMSAQGSDV